MTRILEVLDGSPRWVILSTPREVPGDLREWRMHRAPCSICLVVAIGLRYDKINSSIERESSAT
jgi:hypothetical protein